MKLSEAIAKNKVFLDRGRGWLAWPQFFAIMYTSIAWSLDKYHVRPFGIRPSLMSAIGVVCLFAGLLIIAKLEFKWGIFQAENKRHSETNPVTMEIMERLKRIENKIDK